MRYSSRFRVPALTLGLAALVAGCMINTGGGVPARFIETRNITAAHTAGSAIHVLASNGAIQLHPGDSPEVQITAKLRCISQQRLDETKIIADRGSDGLRIEVAWPGGQPENNEGCSFDVVVPSDMSGVTARSTNGSITIVGLAGGAIAHSSNGAVSITDHKGAVNATTSNGAIDIVGARRDVEARTSNGRVTVRLADESPGPVRIRTSNGAIELTIGHVFAGELNASTSNGSIDIDNFTQVKSVSMHKNSARLVFGDGGAPSVLRTSNGPIHVQQGERR